MMDTINFDPPGFDDREGADAPPVAFPDPAETENAAAPTSSLSTGPACHCTPHAICYACLGEQKGRLVERWGKAPLAKGWTAIPNKLLLNQRELQVDANGLMLLAHLISFQQSLDTKIFPSHQTLAARMGVSKDTVTRAQKKLEANGLIEVERRQDREQGHAPNVYTWTGLIRRLGELPSCAVAASP